MAARLQALPSQLLRPALRRAPGQGGPARAGRAPELRLRPAARAVPALVPQGLRAGVLPRQQRRLGCPAPRRALAVPTGPAARAALPRSAPGLVKRRRWGAWTRAEHVLRTDLHVSPASGRHRNGPRPLTRFLAAPRSLALFRRARKGTRRSRPRPSFSTFPSASRRGTQQWGEVPDMCSGCFHVAPGLERTALPWLTETCDPLSSQPDPPHTLMTAFPFPAFFLSSK